MTNKVVSIQQYTKDGLQDNSLSKSLLKQYAKVFLVLLAKPNLIK